MSGGCHSHPKDERKNFKVKGERNVLALLPGFFIGSSCFDRLIELGFSFPPLTNLTATLLFQKFLQPGHQSFGTFETVLEVRIPSDGCFTTFASTGLISRV